MDSPARNNQHHTFRGFTLVELAIVLIVIGLIVGGVLAGQSLVRSARIAQSVRNIQQISSIVYAFQLRYDCLPGDCSKASQYNLMNPSFSSQPADTFDGDGNGIICNFRWYYDSWFSPECPSGRQNPAGASIGEEGVNFWFHLAASFGSLPVIMSSFDRDSFSEFPVLTSGLSPIIVGAINGSPSNWMHISNLQTGDGNGFSLNPYSAWAIDRKIDDALPYSGTVMSERDWASDDNAGPPPGSGGNTPLECALSPTQYNLSVTVNACRLAIRADWN